MSSLHFDNLREQLSRVLSIDLNSFDFELQDEEWVSSFLGLNLHSVFQPVYDSETAQWFGHEAFLRAWSRQGEVIPPRRAFGLAEDRAQLVSFDRIARTLHILNYQEFFEAGTPLFLNVHGKLIAGITRHGRVFEEILHAHSIPTRDVVIEIQEDEVEDEVKLMEAVTNYRSRGYRIAIDGFGRRHSNLERLWLLSPEFVKFDQSIIRTAVWQTKVRSVLPRLIGIIREIGAQPIFGGIETPEDLTIARESGATLFQGYLFSRPASALHWQHARSWRRPVFGQGALSEADTP